MKRAIFVFSLIIQGLRTTSLSCDKGFFYNISKNTCQECHVSCRENYCVGPEEKNCINKCLSSSEKQILSVDNFECISTCPTGIVLEYQRSFRFCKSPQIYIDQNIQESTLQLGTNDYPLQSLDKVKIINRLTRLLIVLKSDGQYLINLEGLQNAATILLSASQQNTIISINNTMETQQPDMIMENLTIINSEDKEINWLNNIEFINCFIVIRKSAFYSQLFIQNSTIKLIDSYELHIEIYKAFLINSTIIKQGNDFKTEIRIIKSIQLIGNVISGLNATKIKTQSDSNIILKNNRVLDSRNLTMDLQSESIIFENNFFENLHVTEPLITISSSYSLNLSRLTFTAITLYSHTLFHLILRDSIVEKVENILFSQIQVQYQGGRHLSQALFRINGETADKTPLNISSLKVFDLLGPLKSSFKMMIIDDCQEININESSFQRIKTSIMIQQLCGNLNIKNTQFMDLQLNGKQPLLYNQKFINLQNCSFNNIKSQSSIVKFKDYGILSIIDTEFKKVITSDRGAIINISGFPTKAIIINSTFIQNSAFYGGLALIINNASASFLNCSFFSNFALKSGLIHIIEANNLIIENSTLQMNFAFANSILTSDEVNKIEIIGSEISQNQVLWNEDLNENQFSLLLKEYTIDVGEFTNKYYLTWKQNYQIFQETSKYFYQISSSHTQLFVLSTVIQNQTSIVSLERGIIEFVNVDINNILIEKYKNQQNYQSLFQAEERGFIRFSKTIIHNIFQDFDQALNISPYLFIINKGQLLAIESLTYRDSNVPFVKFIDSTFEGLSYQIKNISIPCNLNTICPHFIHGIKGLTNLIQFEMSNIKYQFINNFINSVKKFSLPSIFYAEKQEFKLLTELNRIQIKNVLNCRIIFAIKQTNIFISNIEISDIKFDQEYQNVTFEYGASALFIKDSQFQGKFLRFYNIQSYQGASVFQIVASKHEDAYSIYNQVYRIIIDDSEFYDNFGELSAINIIDQNATFVRNKFYNNTSQSGNGGAISLKCTDQSNLYWCEFNILSNNFKHNSALRGRGGAIYYDFHRPIQLLQNNFSDNRALDWNDFTKPLAKLNQLEKNIKFYSGSRTSFSISLLDQFDQIIDHDSTSIARISYYRPDQNTISGSEQIYKVEKGIAIFNNMIIIGEPGSKSSMEVAVKYYDLNSNSFKDKSLKIDFQMSDCENGEIIQNMQCISCPIGFYSFENNSTKCQKCFENGECLGKNFTKVLPGYWRETQNSDKIFSCLRYESCSGGMNSSCKDGYSGKLCTQCLNQGTSVYRKAGYTKCVLCLSKTQLMINYLLWFTIMELYCIYTLRQLILKGSRLKPSTLFIRIFINYVQTLRNLLQLNYYQPNQLQTLFKWISISNNDLESIFSFDCLLWLYGFDLDSLDVYRIQIIIFGTLPLFLTVLNYGFIKFIQYILNKIKRQKNLKPEQPINIKEVLSEFFFILSNLFYQTIANLLMGMFNCMKLDNNDDSSYLIFDIKVKCWSWQDHISKVLPLTIIFGSYIIIYPIFIFWKLYMNRNQQAQIFRVYGVFLTGFKYEYYFWEVAVSFSQRLLFIAAVIFLPRSNIIKKSMILVIFVYSQILIRKINQPFIDPLINSIDLHSQYSTICLMLTFLIEDWLITQKKLFLSLQLLALVYNIFFILLWFYYWLRCVIEWNLNELSTFRLINSIVIMLKKHGMINYIEQLKLRNTDISLYLDTSETSDSLQQSKQNRMDQYTIPESSRYILEQGGLTNAKIQGSEIKRKRTRIHQAYSSSAI